MSRRKKNWRTGLLSHFLLEEEAKKISEELEKLLRKYNG